VSEEEEEEEEEEEYRDSDRADDMGCLDIAGVPNLKLVFKGSGLGDTVRLAWGDIGPIEGNGRGLLEHGS